MRQQCVFKARDVVVADFVGDAQLADTLLFAGVEPTDREQGRQPRLIAHADESDAVPVRRLDAPGTGHPGTGHRAPGTRPGVTGTSKSLTPLI